MIYLYGLVNGCYWGFLRRWFGGGFKDTRIGNNRGVQAVVMILSDLLVSLPIPLYFNHWVVWSLWCGYAAISYGLYWSRAIGPEFDCGQDEKPSDATISRYYKYWYHKVVAKIVPNHKYGRLYDFLCMTFRYGCPFLITIPLGGQMAVCGLMSSFIYVTCWYLWETEKWMFEKFKTIEKATNLAEYVTGFVYGFSFVMFVKNILDCYS